MAVSETERIEDSYVVVGAHWDLLVQKDPTKLEDEILRLLKENKRMSVSSIWKRTGCHLWEVDAALSRLMNRDLVTETELST